MSRSWKIANIIRYTHEYNNEQKGLNPSSYNRRPWSPSSLCTLLAKRDTTRFALKKRERETKIKNSSVERVEKRRNRVFVSSGHCRVRETLGTQGWGEEGKTHGGRKFTKSQRWNESTRGNAKQGFQHSRNSFQGIRGISYTRSIHAKNSEHVNLGKSCE